MICFPLPLLPLSYSFSSLFLSLFAFVAHLSRLSDFLCRQQRQRVRCVINDSKIIYFALCMRKSMQPASSLLSPPATHAALQASVSLTTYPSSRTKSAELLQCNWLVSLSLRSTLTGKYLRYRIYFSVFNKALYVYFEYIYSKTFNKFIVIS